MTEMETPQDKRAWAEQVLGQLFRLVGIRVRLEVKELEPPAPGGTGLSVAVFPEEEVPALQAGRRSPFLDSLQFLSNKIVNRGPDKKWIAMAVGGHPEPRVPGAKPPRQEAAPRPPRAAPARSAPVAAPPAAPPPPRAERPARPPPEPEADESTAEVPKDPHLEALGRRLAQKAASLGRVYAVLPMPSTQRAQLSRGGQDVPGISVRFEGEGRHRRVVFLPANPKPMPKKLAMPDYDEDDSEE